MTNNKTAQVIEYQTKGVCCKLIKVLIENEVVSDVEFVGGCQGNLAGIRQLVKGLGLDEVISKLQGIKCGSKSTSCPDQLAKCLSEYKTSVEVKL